MNKRRRAKSSIVRSRPESDRTGKALFGLVCACVLALGAFLGSSASAVAAEACPNEQLRQENNSLALPDCRAYEQVSAVDKAGNDAGPLILPNVGNFPPTFLAIQSSDGDGFAYGSMGAFAGAESGWPVSYVARRTGTGWTSTPVSPPTNGKENAANPQAFSGDLDVAGFTFTRGPGPYGQGPGLYVREPDGSFTWASPGVKTLVTYRGASADVSHQIYESSEELLSGVPAPPIGTAHVYEWFEGSLRLVDRLPGETIPPNGAVVGAGGASVGNGTGNTRHAVSQDGSHIVFSSPASTKSTSAEPTQIYVRIDGTHTVDASASQCTRIAPEAACSAPALASYEDAATDGSRVLFITTQQLVNGDEDAVADLYSYDVAGGTLTRLSAGLGGATHVMASSADAETVYFTAGSDHNLYVSDHGTVRPIAEGNFASSQCPSNVSVTPSGGAFAFVTSFPLTPAGGVAGPSGVYRYDDTGSGTLTLVAARGSASSAGSFGSGGCGRTRALSDDGSYLGFSTPAPLVEADHNTLSDVYLWHDGELSLISSGTGEGKVEGANFMVISPSGRDLDFTSFDRLAPTDTDISQDIYDARIDGGFALVGESPPCAGDACRGSGSGSPGGPAAGTVGFSGSGNVATTAAIAVGAAVKGSVATLRVRVPSAGAVTASGKSVRRATSTTHEAGTAVLRVTLTKRARQALARRARQLTPKARSRPARMAVLRTSVRVTFAPTTGPRSAKRVVVTFKRPARAAGDHQASPKRSSGAKGGH